MIFKENLKSTIQTQNINEKNLNLASISNVLVFQTLFISKGGERGGKVRPGGCSLLAYLSHPSVSKFIGENILSWKQSSTPLKYSDFTGTGFDTRIGLNWVRVIFRVSFI